MKKLLLWMCALAACPGLFAQNITGSWQGTLQTPQGRPLRLVIKVTRADDESLKAVLYSIDQAGGQPINATSATLQGSAFKMAIAGIGGNYDGKLNADGNSITGTWSQGGAPAPLVLARATPETA